MTTKPQSTETLEPYSVCKFHWNMIVMPGDRHNRNCPHFHDADKGCACHGCGQRYKVDVMVPDDLWNRIRPEDKTNGAGLLCGRCIFSRIEALSQFAAFILSPASAAPVVDEEALKKRARQIIDAVIESPVIVEVRTFSQPEEVDKLEDRVAALLQKSIPAAATAAQTKSCGFCGKSDQEVKVLIQAPVGYICDECVAVCASIIERNRTAAPVEQSGAKWDQSGLKEACQRALKLGRTHQEIDIQLFLDMLLEIERLEGAR